MCAAVAKAQVAIEHVSTDQNQRAQILGRPTKMSTLASMAGLRLGRRMIWSIGSLPNHPSSPRSAAMDAVASRIHAVNAGRRSLVAFFSTPPATVETDAAEPDGKKKKQSNKKQKGEKGGGGGEKGDKGEKEEPQPSYYELKTAAKMHRTALYAKWADRQERLKTRRAGRPRTFYRDEFRQFFTPQKVADEYHQRKARQAGLEWEMAVASIVQRPNIVQPDREPWEVDMEVLQVHLSQFGKRYPKELGGEDNDKPLTQDQLLAGLPFKPAPRETAADLSGDIRTLERKLKAPVYLFVNMNNNKNNKEQPQNWEFPSVTLQPDELLLDGAKRALQPFYGLSYWCPSNAPWAVQMTPFTLQERQHKPGLYGRKTFFLLLQYEAGTVPDTFDYGWLDRGEITQRVSEQQQQRQEQQQPNNNNNDYDDKSSRRLAKLYHYML
jgi:large subunit ribosomal protein L46